MVTVVRAKDGTIKTFSEFELEDYNKALGETLETVDCTFQEYASRFIVSCAGRSGETIYVPQNTGDLHIDISTPDADTVDVAINGSIETLTPMGGVSHIVLSTEVAGIFIIEPADRTKYCAAGEGKLVVEVTL